SAGTFLSSWLILEGQRIYSPWKKPSFAEVEFSFIIHHAKFVIPTGGTAALAVPERRNLSSTSDFGLSARTNRPEGVTLETVRDCLFVLTRHSAMRRW